MSSYSYLPLPALGILDALTVVATFQPCPGTLLTARSTGRGKMAMLVGE
jgi:hypothetical protein